MQWGSAVGLKVSARCSRAIRSHVDGWISFELRLSCCTATEKVQSQSLRLDPYVSHRQGSIVVLPAGNRRWPPDKYGQPTLGRPSVRGYPTLRAWSPVCGSTLRVSQAARQRWLLAVAGLVFFILFECCGINSYFLATQSVSPHR